MSAVAIEQTASISTSHKNDTTTTDTDSKAEETPDIKELSITPSTKQENPEPQSSSKEEADDEKKEEEGGSSESDSEEEESSDEESDDLYAGLSKEDIAKLKANMGQIQNDYADHCDHEKREMIKETKDMIQFNLSISVSDAEAEFIGKFVKEYDMDLVQNLEDEGIQFLQQMKLMMDQANESGNNNSNTVQSGSEDDYEFPDTDDEDWVVNEKRKKAARAAKRKGANKNTNLDGSKRCGRLLLNDALKNVGSMEGWSDARKKAWTNRRTAPNAYFYRFNVPGQPQKNGKWTKEEHALFMKRIMEFGANDQWGIFSKKIPGRVGYQCSNYWRGLVKDGDVLDPNYHYDGKKLHFKRNTKAFRIPDEYRRFAVTIVKDYSKVWSNLPAKHPKHPSEEDCDEVKEALAGISYAKGGGAKKKKRKRNNGDDSDGEWDAKPTKRRRRARKRYTDDDGDEVFSCSVKAPEIVQDDDNPMPDFIDIMTGAGVEKPAISPYGHVLGYETWTMLLRTSKHKNVCPFTMQKLTRRSLIKLTKDNYEEHKENIVNITDEQKQLMASLNN